LLDIVVPVYNESDNILKLFDEIDTSIKSDKRVLIVYDFDEDTTVPIVENNKIKYGFDIELVKNTYGKGACNAIKYGLKNSTEDKILVMMADLSDRLDVVDTMIERINEGADVVCGSRYMKGGEQHGGPFLKSLFSRMAGISLHLISGIPTYDVTNSFKMYSRQLINAIELESIGGFEIGLEICVKAYIGRYVIEEVPSRWYDREDGESHFHMWKWMPHYLKWYLYCFVKVPFGINYSCRRKNIE